MSVLCFDVDFGFLLDVWLGNKLEIQIDDSETFSDWQEDETVEIQGLFTNKIFNSVSSLLETEKTNFNFDLKRIALNCGVVDDISCIMLVNFIRKEVMQYENINESVLQQLTEKINTKEFLKDESNMIPAVKDDPLLYLISEVLIVADDDMDEKWDNTVEKFIFLNKVSADKSQHDTNNSTEVTEILKSLKDNYEDVVIESKSGDSSYFGSYSNLSIHETMLRDYARTHAYEMAILSNSEYVKDKVVLDIGCGTGILCMLAAKAGAKRVIGVDCSDIIYKAKDIVAANGYDDVITLVKGKLEDLELEMINDHEVDIIVSEWMGYGLYFENMFSSVIYARDKYLKSQHQGGGVLMPSDAILFIEGFCTNEENDLSDRVSWWKNVHGFDMSELIAPFVSEAQIQDVDIANICTTKCDMHHLDLMTALDDDLDFTAYFEIEATRAVSMKAFVISFDVLFGGENLRNSNVVRLSTGVDVESTHWKQCVLWLDPDHFINLSSGSVITGSIEYRRHEECNRDYDITLKFEFASESGVVTSRSQVYALSS